MRVTPLRQELTMLGLSTSGLKDELVARLIEATVPLPSPNVAMPQRADIARKKTPKNTEEKQLPTAQDPERTYVLRFRGFTPTSYGEGGVGLVLYDAEEVKEVWVARKYLPGDQETRFTSEYQGLAVAFRQIHKMGVRKLIVQSDNEVLLRQLDGKFKVAKEKLKRLYWPVIEAKERFDEFKTLDISAAQNSRSGNLARRAVATKKSLGFEENEADTPAPLEEASSPSPQEIVPPKDDEVPPKDDEDTQPDLANVISPEKTYLLRFDGGSRGNPGLAGAGMVLYNPDNNEEIWCGWKFLEEKATNNEAEYTGLLVGLQCAQSLGIKKLLVEGDSELIVKQLHGIYQVKAEGLQVLNSACKKIIDSFEFFRVSHIPRAENKRADELANQAMDTRESYGFDEY